MVTAHRESECQISASYKPAFMEIERDWVPNVNRNWINEGAVNLFSSQLKFDWIGIFNFHIKLGNNEKKDDFKIDTSLEPLQSCLLGRNDVG